MEQSKTDIKKILILVAKTGENKIAFTNHVSKKLAGKAELVLANISDLYFDIDHKGVHIEINGKNITDYDLVYIRSAGSKYTVLASTLSLGLKSLGIKFIDNVWAEIKPVGNKFTALVKLASHKLPIFRSIYLVGHNLDKYKERIVKDLGFPVIAKELSTQRGIGVYKIDSIEDFKKLPSEDANGRENQYLFQEFVNFDTEYRVLVLGNDAKVWEEKKITSDNEFRHNVSLGASEEFLDIKNIPEEIKQIAIKSAQVLNLQVAGVDIAINKTNSGYHLIEVNRGPGFTYNDPSSPEMEEMAKFLLEESNK